MKSTDYYLEKLMEAAQWKPPQRRFVEIINEIQFDAFTAGARTGYNESHWDQLPKWEAGIPVSASSPPLPPQPMPHTADTSMMGPDGWEAPRKRCSGCGSRDHG